MNVVFPDDEGPATVMIRTVSAREEIASAIRPIHFS